MSGDASPAAAVPALVERLRRYPVAAVYAPDDSAARIAFAAALPELETIDLLDTVSPANLDALLAADVVTRTEAPDRVAPVLVLGSEALWSPLASLKLEDAWRALACTEAPPAPRILLLRSPLFLDRLARAFDGSPEPGRLLRWIP